MLPGVVPGTIVALLMPSSMPFSSSHHTYRCTWKSVSHWSCSHLHVSLLFPEIMNLSLSPSLSIYISIHRYTYTYITFFFPFFWCFFKFLRFILLLHGWMFLVFLFFCLSICIPYVCCYLWKTEERILYTLVLKLPVYGQWNSCPLQGQMLLNDEPSPAPPLLWFWFKEYHDNDAGAGICKSSLWLISVWN